MRKLILSLGMVGFAGCSSGRGNSVPTPETPFPVDVKAEEISHATPLTNDQMQTLLAITRKIQNLPDWMLVPDGNPEIDVVKEDRLSRIAHLSPEAKATLDSINSNCQILPGKSESSPNLDPDGAPTGTIVTNHGLHSIDGSACPIAFRLEGNSKTTVVSQNSVDVEAEKTSMNQVHLETDSTSMETYTVQEQNLQKSTDVVSRFTSLKSHVSKKIYGTTDYEEYVDMTGDVQFQLLSAGKGTAKVVMRNYSANFHSNFVLNTYASMTINYPGISAPIVFQYYRNPESIKFYINGVSQTSVELTALFPTEISSLIGKYLF